MLLATSITMIDLSHNGYIKPLMECISVHQTIELQALLENSNHLHEEFHPVIYSDMRCTQWNLLDSPIIRRQKTWRGQVNGRIQKGRPELFLNTFSY